MTNLEKLIRGDDLSEADRARVLKKVGVYWSFAQGLASLSCCKRMGVGCLIVRPDLSEVLAVGYNGPPAGLPNESCRGTQGTCGCTHAEGNAVSKLRTESSGLVMFTTTLQCEHCAGLVINSRRIQYVVYGHQYRDANGAKALYESGLVIRSFEELVYGDEEVPL